MAAQDEETDHLYRALNDTTSGGAVTANSSCCANCGEPLRNGGPIYRFFGMPAMQTRWMAGAVAHKSG